MVWTVSSFTSGEVLTSSEMNALQDNFEAMTVPDSGASLYGQAWPTSWSTQGTIVVAPGLYWYPDSGYYLLTGAGDPYLYIGGSWRGSPGSPGHGNAISDGSTLRYDLDGNIKPAMYWHKF